MLILVVALAAALAVLLATALFGRPPREEALLQRFSSNRPTYERLRDMVLADKSITAVLAPSRVRTKGSIVARRPEEVGFPASRHAEYVSLLNKVHARRVDRIDDSEASVCISVWGSGFAGNTRHVDLCWLDYTPKNQVASLAEFYRRPKPRRPAFRHVDANWYLWADW